MLTYFSSNVESSTLVYFLKPEFQIVPGLNQVA